MVLLSNGIYCKIIARTFMFGRRAPIYIHEIIEVVKPQCQMYPQLLFGATRKQLT